MKTFHVVVASLFLFAASLSAGYQVVHEVEVQGETYNLVLKSSESKARVDMDQTTSMILDVDSDQMMILIHPQRAYMEIDQKQTEAMMEQLKRFQDMLGQSEPEAGEITMEATGNTDTIAGMQAREYRWSDGTREGTLWFSDDMPHQEEILGFMRQMQNSPLAGGAGSVGPDLDDLPGYPLKSVTEEPGVGTVTMTVTSVEEVDHPASEFEKPEGYRGMSGLPGMNMQMPQMP